MLVHPRKLVVMGEGVGVEMGEGMQNCPYKLVQSIIVNPCRTLYAGDCSMCADSSFNKKSFLTSVGDAAGLCMVHVLAD